MKKQQLNPQYQPFCTKDYEAVHLTGNNHSMCVMSFKYPYTPGYMGIIPCGSVVLVSEIWSAYAPVSVLSNSTISFDNVLRTTKWPCMATIDPKSQVLCIKSSSGRVCDPQVSIAGDRIQEAGNSEFKFLGMFRSLVIKRLPKPPSKRQ